MSRLNCNDMGLIRWICSGKLTDKNADGLRSRLGLCSIENVLRRGRLCCYSHIQYTDPVTGSKKVDKTIITGSNPRGRRRNTWLECVRNDLKLKGWKHCWKRIGLHGVAHSIPRVDVDVTIKECNTRTRETTHVKPWSQSVSQSAGQPASQPVSQPASQSARQPPRQPAIQSARQPASQPVSQAGRQAGRQTEIKTIKNDIIGIVLVSVLLALNIFHTLF